MKTESFFSRPGPDALNQAFTLWNQKPEQADLALAKIQSYFAQSQPAAFDQGCRYLFHYLIATDFHSRPELNSRPELKRFIYDSILSITALLAHHLDTPEYWQDHPSGIDAILRLVINLQKADSYQVRLQAGQLVEQITASLIDHITNHDINPTLLIHRILADYFRHHNDPVATDRLLTRLQRNHDPGEYLIFLQCGNRQVETDLQQWFEHYLQTEFSLDQKQSVELLERWRRSDPLQAPLAFQRNYQAMQKLESNLPGAVNFLVQHKLVYCFDRYPLPILIEQVQRLNSHNQEKVKPPRSVNFLVVKPYDDHSGKMYDGKDSLTTLHTKMKKAEARNHGKVAFNLLVMEYGAPLDMLHNLESWVQQFGLFDGLIEHSHGNQDATGGTLYMRQPYDQITTDSIQRLLQGMSLRPQSSFLARLMACFKPVPKFVLESCLVGWGPDSLAANISQAGAETFASDDSTSSICFNFGFNRVARLEPYFLGGKNLRFRQGVGEEYQASSSEFISGLSRRAKKILQNL